MLRACVETLTWKLEYWISLHIGGRRRILRMKTTRRRLHAVVHSHQLRGKHERRVDASGIEERIPQAALWRIEPIFMMAYHILDVDG